MATRNVWRLIKRPVGSIADGDLGYGTEPAPALEDGQFSLRVIYLSLDPTNRIWMRDEESYLPPVAINAPMRGVVLGRVIESRRAGIDPGTLHAGVGEWAEIVVTDGATFRPFPEFPGIDLASAFGTLNLVGPTAYFGLLDIGDPRPGETLVVSSAAGGVGQVAGQIGKIKGCRVIGIAGGKAKCDYVVDELGFDAAIDHRSEDVGEALDRLAPDGVDVNFEQVGGPIMAAVLARMRPFGRVPLCGLISQYNGEAPEAPPIWTTMLSRRLTVRGFIVLDFAPRLEEATRALAGWMAEGRLRTRQDVRPGLGNASAAVRDLFTGANFGKLMIEVSKP